MFQKYKDDLKKAGLVVQRGLGIFNNPYWNELKENIAGKVRNKEVAAKWAASARKGKLKKQP